jgi:AcrR family transcriptional regulator
VAATHAQETGSGGRPYAGLSPDARRAERRRRLLEAGLETFAGTGYAGATIGELCRAAGVAPTKFYEEFSGKEELLVAVATEVATDAVNTTLTAWAAAPPDLSSRAEAALSGYLHTLLDDPRRARVVCVEMVGISESLERMRRGFLRDLADLLVALLAEAATYEGGAAPAADETTRLVGTVLLGGLQEAIVEWLFDPDRPTIDCLATTLAGLLVVIGHAALQHRPESGL